VLDGELANCRLPPDAEVPRWASAGPVMALARSSEELSIVCASASVPDGLTASSGWRALRVAGTLEHSMTGILASLATPLAAAEIPIFAISTYDTDYVLVPADRLPQARVVLLAAGHRLAPTPE